MFYTHVVIIGKWLTSNWGKGVVNYINMFQHVERKLNLHLKLQNHPVLSRDRHPMVMDLDLMVMPILSYLLMLHTLFPRVLPSDMLLPHLKDFLEAQRTCHYIFNMRLMSLLTCGMERKNIYLIMILNIWFVSIILIELLDIDILILAVLWYTKVF